MSTDTKTRVLFLVTTPIKKSTDRCLYELERVIGGNRSQTQEIDWDNTSSPVSSIPTIKPHLSFTRHFALGVMDRNDWDDPTLTNLQRFHKASFWEHRGSTEHARLGRTWGEGEIRQIEAIQFFGWTEKPNDLITNEYASILLQGWGYLPVWWNCQSFATRLVFLVVELETFRDRAAALARELHTELVQWVISRRDLLFSKAFISTYFTSVGSSTGAAVSAFVFPPAWGIFVDGFISGWCLALATGVSATIFQRIDAIRYEKFRANSEQLETKFPLLREFHSSLY